MRNTNPDSFTRSVSKIRKVLAKHLSSLSSFHSLPPKSAPRSWTNLKPPVLRGHYCNTHMETHFAGEKIHPTHRLPAWARAGAALNSCFVVSLGLWVPAGTLHLGSGHNCVECERPGPTDNCMLVRPMQLHTHPAQPASLTSKSCGSLGPATAFFPVVCQGHIKYSRNGGGAGLPFCCLLTFSASLGRQNVSLLSQE